MDPLKLLPFGSSAQASDAADSAAPLGGTRSEAIQRLQVGVSGIGAMLLLVALANVIQDRARVSDETAVPEAAPTTEPSPLPPPNDPLADAGVVPDLPVEPTPAPTSDAVSEDGAVAIEDLADTASE